MEQKEADLDVEESKQDILGKGRIARLFGRKDLLSGFYPFFQVCKIYVFVSSLVFLEKAKCC